MLHYDILIVGAGHGGAQAALSLRQQGFAGTIAIVGDEPELPYERPPLSKEYLLGEKDFERILIRPTSFWVEREIPILTGVRVIAVDPAAKRVTIAGGETIGYNHLIWAAGGRPRMLSVEGSDLAGVHVVRTRRDVDAMMEALDRTANVVVVGGGYIGLEAAAALVKLGKKVVVLEALPRVLARVAGKPLSRFYEARHRAEGVDVKLEAQIDAFVGEGGKITGVRLANGDILPADMIIVGIGIIPAVEPLLAAGAAGGNGVDVDEYCRTSLPDIYAIGDCAAHENGFCGGERIRLESVQNANDQASVVARVLAGEAQPYRAVPWFWSNQYDLRLQTVGISTGYDDIVVRGDLVAPSFSIVYLKAGKVVALDCVNATRDYVQGRKLVTEGAVPDRTRLADASVPLKELAA